MQHFESIVHAVLEFEGYWVRSSYKVELTKAEKVLTGKHSIPRPEIDLLAYHVGENKLLVLDVKSYLDSLGVRLKDLEERHDLAQGRYKLFTSRRYRKVVFARLKKQLVEDGAINGKTKMVLGLVAGKVYQNEVEKIGKLLKKERCEFYSPEWVREKVQSLATRGYENNAASITAKILLNGK
ncbi:MAG: hypothetical protein EOP88_05770 [Verrucomicrobiaceae bacterium]|nr:MAG: hypothetical protein EOP88_05770 [Verrucomicrobiaceae bacterium]